MGEKNVQPNIRACCTKVGYEHVNTCYYYYSSTQIVGSNNMTRIVPVGTLLQYNNNRSRQKKRKKNANILSILAIRIHITASASILK